MSDFISVPDNEARKLWDSISDPFDIKGNQIVFDRSRGRVCLFSNSADDVNYWLMFPIYGIDRGKPYITKIGKKIYFDYHMKRELEHYMNSINLFSMLMEEVRYVL